MNQQDETLEAGLTQSYRDHQREIAIDHIAGRTHLNLGQIAKLVANEQHGDVVASITLQDILNANTKPQEIVMEGDEEIPLPKKGATKSKSSKKNAAPKSTKKSATKTGGPKVSTGKKMKADAGKPKPRLDYDQGKREVLAALRTAKSAGQDSLGRASIETATGFTAVQVRTFAKKLVEEGKIKILGEGGRSTTYSLT